MHEQIDVLLELGSVRILENNVRVCLSIVASTGSSPSMRRVTEFEVRSGKCCSC